MTHKLCRACGENKPFEAFSIVLTGKGARNNLRSRCKVCRTTANRTWHEKNKQRSLDNHRRWLEANPEQVRAQSKKWMTENPARHAEISRTWRQKNPARNAAKSARYHARQLRATPPWLTAIHEAQIEEFYEVAAARTVQLGIEHHVDHIYPLQGKTSRGLHVPWNLQVLTASANAVKKNYVPEEARDGLRV